MTVSELLVLKLVSSLMLEVLLRLMLFGEKCLGI